MIVFSGGLQMIYQFDDLTLDVARRELCRGEAAIKIEPQAFDVLSYLIENRNRVVSKDDLVEAIWDGRFVSESALSSRIRDVRVAVGDNGRDQKTIKTIHGRGFRFVADLAAREGAPDLQNTETRSDQQLQQEVRYFKSFDGTRIAYSDIGDSDVVILKTANWMSHLEYDLESPIWRHWISEIGKGVRLIRYDERGNGLSDWNVGQVTYDDCVRDLECLVEHLGLKKFSLFGISQGASVAVDFAVRQPAQVDKIIIYGGFVQGWRFQKDENALGQRIAMGMLMRTGWGQSGSEFRQLFTSRFMPEATPEQADWFNELQRKSVAPEMAGNLHDMFGTIDVSHLLDQVKAPTLVMHSRQDAEIPIGNGRAFATGIPGARFVSLESKNHILLEHEPAFGALVDNIRNFIAS